MCRRAGSAAVTAGRAAARRRGANGAADDAAAGHRRQRHGRRHRIRRRQRLGGSGGRPRPAGDRLMAGRRKAGLRFACDRAADLAGGLQRERCELALPGCFCIMLNLQSLPAHWRRAPCRRWKRFEDVWHFLTVHSARDAWEVAGWWMIAPQEVHDLHARGKICRLCADASRCRS